MSNSLYDKLKSLALIILPALGTLYFALAENWEAAVIFAIDFCLGMLLQLSSLGYIRSEAQFDGTIEVIDQGVEGKLYSLNLKGDPEEIDQKDQILFKVSKPEA